MGIIAPNQKKLLIPRKGAKVPNAPVSQADHDANMRAIEIWANAQAPGGVTQIIAGTDITISPPDGLGTVTINASGGGGGSTPGFSQAMGGPDEDNDLGVYSIFLGSSPTFGTPVVNGNIFTPLFSNSSGIARYYTVGQGWATYTAGGDSVSYLPTAVMPAYTGGPVLVSCEITALAIDASNYAVYDTGQISIASGVSYQFKNTDFSQTGGYGSDLSLVGGSGNSGTGLVTAAGGVVYLGSFQMVIEVPTAVTFT